MAIGEISFGECLAVHTKNLADGPTYLEAAPQTPKPHHTRGLMPGQIHGHQRGETSDPSRHRSNTLDSHGSSHWPGADS